jgi:hypothetical protein
MLQFGPGGKHLVWVNGEVLFRIELLSDRETAKPVGADELLALIAD